MKTNRIVVVVTAVVGLLISMLVAQFKPVDATAAPAAQAKLIALSGVLKPFRYLEHRTELESLPFDGYAIALQASWQPFFSDGVNASGLAQDQADLATIGRDRLKDSFALIWATPAADGWDWFDDAAWERGEAAIRTIARTARDSGMKGVMFDPEAYDDRFVWGYDAQRLPTGYSVKPSFDDYRTQVFRRGQRFIRILQEEAPNLTVMTTRMFTDVAADLKNSATYEDFLKARQENLYYGLGESFAAGMVGGVVGDTILIEGNERAYDYTTAADFTRANAEIRDDLRWLAYTNDRETYDRVVQPGHASYTNGVIQESDGRFIGFYLPNRSARLHVLQDNVRNSIEQSPTYAWLFAEGETPLWDMAANEPDVLAAITTGKSAAGSGQRPATDPSIALAARDAYVNSQIMLGVITGPSGPLAGVTVTPTGSGMSCQPSDATGMYFCQGRKGWSGTLTPVLSGYRFSPGSRFVEPLNAFRNGLHFEAEPG